MTNVTVRIAAVVFIVGLMFSASAASDASASNSPAEQQVIDIQHDGHCHLAEDCGAAAHAPVAVVRPGIEVSFVPSISRQNAYLPTSLPGKLSIPVPVPPPDA